MLIIHKNWHGCHLPIRMSGISGFNENSAQEYEKTDGESIDYEKEFFYSVTMR